MHAVAPSALPVSVMEPAGHSMQSSSVSEPVTLTNFPAAQSAPLGKLPNFPASHPQLAAPTIVLPGQSRHADSAAEPGVSTYLPALQLVHADAVDAVEYWPAAHSVHVVAPVLVPVLVIEPAGQSEQSAEFDTVLRTWSHQC